MSSPAILTVNGPDFTLASQPPTVAVKAGSTATYMLFVSGIDGFTGSVAVICSLPAAATTCTANPSSVANGSSTTITVTTTAHQLIPSLPTVRFFSPLPTLLVITVFLVAALLFFASRQFARDTRRLILGTACSAILAFFVLSGIGCGGAGGGGGSTPSPVFGTQAGSYTVTITATSNSTTHSTTATLVVN